MKIAFIFRIFAVVCCLGFLPFAPVAASAPSEGAGTVSVSLDALNSDRPVQLSGLISSVSLDIHLPDYTRTSGSSLVEFELQASPLLDMQRSSLTVALNDLQASTLRLADSTGKTLRVELPADALKPGTNRLTFTGMLYLTTDENGVCQNWNDPARWLNLAPGGTLQLGVSASKKSFDLSAFPDVFGDPASSFLQGGPARTLFVLPDDPQRDDLSAVVSLAYALGAQEPAVTQWQPEVIYVSGFSSQAAAERNLVFVNVFPAELGETQSSLRDWVSLRTSPWDAQRAALTIADRNRSDGTTPADVFSRPVQKVLLKDHLAFVDELAPASTPVVQKETTFQSLGYSDRTVKGIGESSLTYRLFLPNDVRVGIANLSLILAHAPDLGTKASSLTVYVNGYAIAGILPNERSAGALPIAISVPASRLRPGENFIRLTFDLKAGYSSCEKNPDAIWATVLNTSSINLTLRDNDQPPTLDSFPMPFSDNPGTLFLLPDQPDGKLVGQVAQLAYQFGAAAMVTDLPPAVIEASEFSASGVRQNVILAGLPSQNPLILKLNTLLPQPFTTDGKALQSGYGITGQDDDEGVGLVQILPSPWHANGVLMVVSGLNEQGQNFAWDILADAQQWRNFTGNLMVAGSDERSEADNRAPAVTFQTTANVSAVPVFGQILQGIQPGNYIPAAVSIVSALVLVLIVLLMLQLRGPQ